MSLHMAFGFRERTTELARKILGCDIIFRPEIAIVPRPYPSTFARALSGEKTKCRNLFRDREAYRRNLPDDNSLQLRVVNGGRAS